MLSIRLIAEEGANNQVTDMVTSSCCLSSFTSYQWWRGVSNILKNHYSYFHHEGVIELFRAEVFPEFLSQRAQPEGSNYPENPRPEKLNRPSGQQCF